MKPRGKITPTKLHRFGYRLSKTRDFYFKRRITRRGESSTIVQIQERGSQWDVNAIEFGQLYHGIEFSRCKTMTEIRGWEAFAFC